MEVLLEHWDLLLLAIISSALLIFVSVAEALGSAGIVRKKVNYGAVTTYAVLSGLVLLSISTLRVKIREHANVDVFLEELSVVADNEFARAKLRQLRPFLDELKNGQVTTGTTPETVENLVRAFEVVNPGMHVVVVNPAPVFRLDESKGVLAAERAAIRRGASISHVDIRIADEDVVYPMTDSRVVHETIGYDEVSQLESFRLHGTGTVFSFGDIWFAEVNIVQSGVGESARCRMLWGDQSAGVAALVHDVSGLVGEASN